MRRPRFTTRWLMALVALVALGFGVDRLRQRWQFCAGRALDMQRISFVYRVSAQITKENLPAFEARVGISGLNRLSRAEITRVREGMAKDLAEADDLQKHARAFERAMWQPWLPVPPEPPLPK